MNIQLKISAKRDDILPATLQRLRRIVSILENDNIETTLVFGDDESPLKEETPPTNEDQYPNITQATLIAIKSLKKPHFRHSNHKVA